MSCQIGIYSDRKITIDQWDVLIYLCEHRSPRDVLRDITPFLREFHTTQDMTETGGLAAWFTWFLIDRGLGTAEDPFGIAISLQIRGDIDFFYKISPGMVEVYRIDELLEWSLIAAVEIPQEAVELGAY